MDILVGKSVSIVSPYDGGSTISGSWLWRVDNPALASVTDMRDGSATLSALSPGLVTVFYGAFGNSLDGKKVSLACSMQFNVLAAPSDVIPVDLPIVQTGFKVYTE